MNRKTVGMLLGIGLFCLVAIGGVVGEPVGDGENQDGWQITEENNVTVDVTAELNVTPKKAAIGEQVTFNASNSTGDIVTYRWDFDGDGTVEETTSNPVTTQSFNQTGFFEPAVQVEDANGSTDTVIGPVLEIVPAGINSTFVFTPTKPTVGTQVAFNASRSTDTNGDIVEYRWDFTGNGTFDAVTAGPTANFTYDTTGEYPVTLEVANSTGGTNDTTRTVSVVDSNLTAAFEFTPNEPVVGEGVSFNATSSSPQSAIVEYRWDLTGDGTFDQITEFPEAEFTYEQRGEYNVTLEIANSQGDTAQTTNTVTVTEGDGGPTLSAEFSSTPGAPDVGEQVTFNASASTGDIVEYRWNLTGNGTFDEVTETPTTTFTYDTAGTYFVLLQVEDSTGETAQITKEITVGGSTLVPVPAFDFDPETPIVGEQVTFDASNSTGNITEYRWDLSSNDSVDRVTTDPVVNWTYDAPGQYSVSLEVVNNDGVTNATSNTVVIEEPPKPFFEVGITDLIEPVEGGDIEVVANVTNTGDAGDTQTVELDVGALGTNTTTATLTSGESTSVTLSVGTSVGDAGSYTATISTANDTVNTTVQVSSDVTFAVSILDATAPFEGEDLAVTAEVTNTGASTGTQTVTLDVSGLGTNQTDVTLAGGASTNLTLSVGTSTGDAGSYAATVSSEDDSATTEALVQAPAEFAVTVNTLTKPVEGDDVVVTATVQNVGDSQDTQTIALDIPGLGSNETSVTLSGSDSTTLTLSVATTAGDTGTYDVTVSSDDDFDTASTTVLGPAAFRVDILSATDPVEGDSLQVTASVENTGDIEATQTVTLDVPGLGSSSTPVTLGGGNATNETLSVGTGAGDAGSYTATVSTENDSDSTPVTVLAPAEFTVDIADVDQPVEGDALSVTTLVENVGNLSGTQTLSLDVGALGTNSTQVTLGGSNSVTETLTLSTAAGDAGEYTATVSTANDTASQGITVLEPGAFTVDIVGTNAPVAAGESVAVTVDVENTGDVEATQTVSLDAGALGTNSTTITLGTDEPAQQTTLSVATGPGDAGSYTATVSTENDTASTSVTVLSAPNFTVDITGTNSPVSEGTQLLVSAEITNTGDQQGEQTVTLDAGVLGTASTTVTLAGGASTTETFGVATGSGDAGSYTAAVSTANDTDSTGVTVEVPAAFTVDIVGTTAPVPEGEPLSVDAEITNTGGVADQQTVELAVGGLGNDSVSVSLDAGNSTIETLSVATGAGDAGTYTATVSTADDQNSTGVTVLAPGESALSGLDVAGQGADATLTEGTDGNVSVLVENVGGQASSFDVTLEIGSTVSQTKSTSELAGGASETLTFESVTGGLAAGTYGVTVSTANDSVTGTLAVQAPAQAALSNLVVAGQGANATIFEGDDEDVALIVENVGEQAGSFDVTLGIGSAVSQTQSTSELAGGASETVVFGSVTGGLSAGEYSVDVSTADDAVSGSLSVQTPAESVLSNLSIAGQGTAATITEGADANVSVVVENVGGQTDSFDVTLAIGSAVSQTQSTGQLAGGESETVVFQGVTGSLSPTEYSVDVSTADDATSGSLTVEGTGEAESALSNLDIAGQGTNATVTEGTDRDVSVVVENVGGASGSFEVTLEVGAFVTQSQSTSALAAGGTETVVFENVTGDLPPTTYGVDVSTADDATSGTLTVEEQAPAESSLSDLDIAGQGSNAAVCCGGRSAHNIEINVTNTGDQSGSFDVTLAYGETLSLTTSTGELAGGATETVTFEDVGGNLTAGTYTVTVSTPGDEVTGTLTVEELPVGLEFSEQNVTQNETVAVENVSSDGIDSLLLVTYEDDGADIVAGVANGTFGGENITLTLEQFIGFPAEYTAHLVPAANASTAYQPGDTLSANTSSEILVSASANVTTFTDAPTIVVGEGPAKDTTGDGLLNDVVGTGSFNIFDIQALFDNKDEINNNDNAEYFNFQGSNPDEVTIFDVQALFDLYDSLN